jgi:hypothetical protein
MECVDESDDSDRVDSVRTGSGGHDAYYIIVGKYESTNYTNATNFLARI